MASSSEAAKRIVEAEIPDPPTHKQNDEKVTSWRLIDRRTCCFICMDVKTMKTIISGRVMLLAKAVLSFTVQQRNIFECGQCEAASLSSQSDRDRCICLHAEGVARHVTLRKNEHSCTIKMKAIYFNKLKIHKEYRLGSRKG